MFSRLINTFLVVLLVGVVGCSGTESGKGSCRLQPCPSKGVGVMLLSVPWNCSQFITCLEGKAIFRHCGTNLHFDKTLQTCRPASEVTCKSCRLEKTRETSETSESSESGENISEEQKSIIAPAEQSIPTSLVPEVMVNNISERCIKNSVTPVKCSVTVSDDKLLPHPDDCQLFYYCVNVALPPICRDCPANLHFNPDKKVCDHPNVAGCRSKVVSGERPKSMPRALKERAVADNFTQCDENNGVLADIRPNPQDCGKYFVCDWGYLIPMSCPEGMHFSTYFNICDIPQNAHCSEQKPILKHTSLQSNDESSEEVFDVAKILIDKRIDFELQSNKQLLDKLQQRLEDTLNELDEGSGSVLAVQCTTTEDEGEVELIPDPESCNSFYICSWGVAKKVNCPQGLHFNPSLLVCDQPQDAGCK